LVVWGKEDALLPIASGERYAAGISGAKLVSLEHCGHVPPIEETAEFLSAVEGFMNQATGTQR
jgi:pimeloyl-ACP methyl ester carboxylesterase